MLARFILLLVLPAGVSGCGREAATIAESRSLAPQAGSAAAPAQLGLCASCHGRNGIAVIPNTPHLAGRDRDELLAAMQAYLDGTRGYAPMRAMLSPLRPDDRARLADWFAAQEAPSEPAG